MKVKQCLRIRKDITTIINITTLKYIRVQIDYLCADLQYEEVMEQHIMLWHNFVLEN